MGDPAVFDAAAAAAVKERCLRALKDRLVEQAALMQQAFEREQADLADRQAWFLKNTVRGPCYTMLYREGCC